MKIRRQKDDGASVGLSIDECILSGGIHITGPRTAKVNGDLCGEGFVFIGPPGFVLISIDTQKGE